MSASPELLRASQGKGKHLPALLPKTKQLIVLPNCPASPALLSSLSENITTHEILFAGSQSVESQLALPSMIHKGKGLYKFPHRPELFSVSFNLLPLPLVSHHSAFLCTTQLSHSTVLFPCILTLFSLFLFVSEFLGTESGT